MKQFSKHIILAAFCCLFATGAQAQLKQDWGDFKLWLDPGHSMRENAGMYGYTEAEKVLRVGLATREYLMEYTTATLDNIQMTRDDDQDNVSLDERSDMANAWGADFFYSIHSDAGANVNETLFLFGGWYENGNPVEKTPRGGKRFAEILDPNLTGVMYQTGSRGPWYDRYFYDRVTNHTTHRPWLSVNRRTNMASMLSEGGFHTLTTQQSLNINESYKRLEAFGTFRAIMEFRGLERPEKVMLAGVITNSENGVPINGVSVTVDDRTIVTDTYESLFNKYSSNPDLIHNGFFLFEGLTPGETYEVTYNCPGFTTATKTVTLNSNPQGLSGENVTWANIELTSSAPAVVSSINVSDPDAVRTYNDIVFTFSRKMNRESVEQAFSINNNGNVTLSWDNDYTLRVNINNLFEDRAYTITIDGSIAKNSQTDQFLDGDSDGEEGGNYVFNFKTVPADLEAPYVASTTPAENSTMFYTLHPAIRIEYNEELAWNEDNATDAIVVEDSNGSRVEGTLTHEVVSEVSVLHFYPAVDLKLDRCYKVTVKGGFKDLSGNESESKVFRFLTEYRGVIDTKLVDECVTGHWWGPDGSGSTIGTTSKTGKDDASAVYIKAVNTHSSKDVTNSLLFHYKFDPDYAGQQWLVREYRSANQNDYNYFQQTRGYTMQACVYGDGSNNKISHMVRLKVGGLKQCPPRVMDFRGWDILAWDINASGENIVTFTGEATSIGPDDIWCYDSFFLRHEMTLDDYDMYMDNEGYDDDGNPILLQAWEGDVIFDDYKMVKYDDEAEQTASLDDIPMTSVDDIKATNITMRRNGDVLNIVAPEAISKVEVYAMNGALVLSAIPATMQAGVNVAGIAPGVYVVKVLTPNKRTAQRFVVK